jgi:hypothetical protein
MAFEMLSGRKAITGKTPLEIARRVATQPPPDLRDTVPGAPDAAAEAIRRGLAKNPDERPPSAGELVRQLEQAYAEQERAAAAPAPVPTAATKPLREDRAEREPISPAPAEIREPTTAPRMHRTSRRPAWLLPAALIGLLGLAAVAIVLATSGGGDEPSTAADSGSAAEERSGNSGSGPDSGSSNSGASDEEQTPEADSSAPAAPAAPAPTPESGGGTPATPDGVVEAFYTAAADDQYEEAWALGTDNLHAQLQSYDSFAASQSTLESIEFPTLEVTEESGDSATVTFRSVARHTDRTDRRCGTIDVVRGSQGWLVDQLHIGNC